MRTTHVSFRKVFDIQYQRFNPALDDKAEKRIKKDLETLRERVDYNNKNIGVEPIPVRGKSSLYPTGIRIMTGDSYRDYQLLRNISGSAAHEFADAEAKTFTVIV